MAALYPSESLDWFNWLDIKDMRSFSEQIPYLTFKPMRVFMSTKWNIAHRKKVIEDTYSFIRTFKGPLQEAILNTEGSTLASFNLNGYGDVKIILCYDNSLRKEGVLMVSLKCASLNEPIIQVAFSLEQKSATSRAMAGKTRRMSITSTPTPRPPASVTLRKARPSASRSAIT